MNRHLGSALAACISGLLLLACGDEPRPIAGIGARVKLDRTEARVGDRLGVTVEIDTPVGYSIEVPTAPASSERFVSDSIERLAAVEVPGGLRHTLLWTLRARAIGDARLPELLVPLVSPDGRIQPLAVGGVPLEIRSVMAELPERDVFFDIRPAPPTDGPGPGVWVVAAGVGLLCLLAIGLAARRGALPSGPNVRELAAEAAAAIDASRSEPDTRALANALATVLFGFVGRRYELPVAAATPGELPDAVEPRLVRALTALQSARFSPAPDRSAVVEQADAARDYFRDVGRR